MTIITDMVNLEGTREDLRREKPDQLTLTEVNTTLGLTCASVLPVVLEAGRVIAVKDVPPAVDVHDARCHGDEQHQRELDHVTDLNQHGGGHQSQHSHVAVVFRVVKATVRARPGGGGGGGGWGHRGTV